MTLLGRNRRVTVDQFGEHPTESFDTQREWGDVEEKQVSDVATEHTALKITMESVRWAESRPVSFTWIAAPRATASSGLTDLFGVFQ